MLFQARTRISVNSEQSALGNKGYSETSVVCSVGDMADCTEALAEQSVRDSIDYSVASSVQTGTDFEHVSCQDRSVVYLMQIVRNSMEVQTVMSDHTETFQEIAPKVQCQSWAGALF